MATTRTRWRRRAEKGSRRQGLRTHKRISDSGRRSSCGCVERSSINRRTWRNAGRIGRKLKSCVGWRSNKDTHRRSQEEGGALRLFRVPRATGEVEAVVSMGNKGKGWGTRRTLKAVSGDDRRIPSGAAVLLGARWATVRTVHSGAKVDRQWDNEGGNPRREDSGGWNSISSPELRCPRQTVFNATIARSTVTWQRTASSHIASGARRQDHQRTVSRGGEGHRQCPRNRDSGRGWRAPGYKYRPSRREGRRGSKKGGKGGECGRGIRRWGGTCRSQ